VRTVFIIDGKEYAPDKHTVVGYTIVKVIEYFNKIEIYLEFKKVNNEN
jgi:hypothetical protein